MELNLSLANLGEIGGGQLGVAFASVAREFAKELDDRGHDKKPRKIIITVEGVRTKSGVIELTGEVKLVMPQYRTDSTQAKMAYDQETKGWQLKFHAFSPESVDEQTLPFGESKAE